jgi:hypothetical protein
MKAFYPGLLLAGLLSGGAASPAAAQALSLPALIAQTQATAAPAQQARAAREGGYWAYRAYQASYRPQLGLAGTVPNFNRAIIPVVQPDGTTEFQSVRYNNSLLALNLSQNIGLTGGQVVIGSQVQRFDDFARSEKRYNNQPFTLGLTQPLGYFNALRWDRRIAPLLYQESQRQYLEAREAIAQRVTELFLTCSCSKWPPPWPARMPRLPPSCCAWAARNMPSAASHKATCCN